MFIHVFIVLQHVFQNTYVRLDWLAQTNVSTVFRRIFYMPSAVDICSEW